jgi:hypothetical protein
MVSAGQAINAFSSPADSPNSATSPEILRIAAYYHDSIPPATIHNFKFWIEMYH